MRIEEIVIEGFKSYESRTYISGWDPEFSAITGLNGSGKSNILDAICFALGTSNLSQIRANNMRDLIYKRGQAGVNKASVTLTFDNSEKDASPTGFESHSRISVTRQIIMGGSSNYIINGMKAQAQAVANLFRSVRLNIDNPHFMIMQGRITKVLNMRPLEILAMIEEVSGTRMFEEKKDHAWKSIAKTEKKVDETKRLLLEEVDPKLENLRTELRHYQEYQKLESEIETLGQNIIIYDYIKNKELLNGSGADLEDKNNEIKDLEVSNERLNEEIANLEDRIQQIIRNKEKESGKGKNTQANAIKEYSNQIVRINVRRDLNRASIDEETKKKDVLLSNKAEINQTWLQKSEEYKRLEIQFEKIKSDHDEECEQLKKEEEFLLAITTGISAESGGHVNGYMEQLQEAKDNASHALTEIERAKLVISHLKKQLNETETLTIKANDDKENYESAKKAVQDLTETLSNINWDPSKEESMLNEETIIQNKIKQLTEQCEYLSSQLSNFIFDPTPNLNLSGVKGLVAELISVKPQYAQCLTALEVCAGGKLYNVIVENEEVGAQIISNKSLRRRVTVIPLDKIRPSKIPAEKLTRAMEIAPEKVYPALSLIDYEEEVTAAVEYVFGNTLICTDADTSKRVTFDKNVRTRSVTLEGDIYDHSGTLQGGSKPAEILLKLQTLKQYRQQLNTYQRELDKIRNTQKIIDEYKKTKNKLEIRAHECAILEQQMNSSGEAIRAVEEIKSQIAEHEKIIVDSTKKRQNALDSCRMIENEWDQFKNNKESKVEDIKKSISKRKSEIARSNQDVVNMQRHNQIIHSETMQLEEDLLNVSNEIKHIDNNIKQLSEAAESTMNELARLKNLLDQAQAELEKESAFDKEISELRETIKTKTAGLNEAQLKISKINNNIEKIQRDRVKAQDAVLQMENKYDWVKQRSEAPNNEYDLINQNPNESQGNLQRLKKRRNSLQKKFNPKVTTMIDSVEKREEQLKQKLTTLKEDKTKIQESVGSLDNHKKEVLRKTLEKVNIDFGEIFSDLLPNSFAKMQPLDGQNLESGLEIKVSLGGVWKKSLSELSGGQRSLVALSLILSLLRYKPAPVYILDEVDAALDLSHTQNIGQILRTRFKESQFIVVSLKEGMFNNANVLFHTTSEDGVSVVERTVQNRT